MATDTSEKELEATIEAYLIDEKGERAESSRWMKGESKDFNPEFCVDETMLKAFLQHTQMDKVTRARIYDSPANTRKFPGAVAQPDYPERRGGCAAPRHGAQCYDLRSLLSDSYCRQCAGCYCLRTEPVDGSPSAPVSPDTTGHRADAERIAYHHAGTEEPAVVSECGLCSETI